MDTLTRLCTVKDPQISALRSMAIRRRRSLLRYEEFIPPFAFLANVSVCGYFQKTMFATADALALFFLAESCFAVALAIVHGSAFLDVIMERSRLLGVRSSRRFIFTVIEFGLHPMLLAQAGSLVLVWFILLHAGMSILAFTLLATLVWYGSLIVCTAAVYVVANRYRIRPPIVGALIGMALFIVLTGPTVVGGVPPYASLPISGWMAHAISSAISGRMADGFLWLLPSVAFSCIAIPFGMRTA